MLYRFLLRVLLIRDYGFLGVSWCLFTTFVSPDLGLQGSDVATYGFGVKV